jgi:Tol biopolymer transport system component
MKRYLPGIVVLLFVSAGLVITAENPFAGKWASNLVQSKAARPAAAAKTKAARLEYEVPIDQTLNPTTGRQTTLSSVAVSPDGKYFAYVVANQRIYLRSLEDSSTRQIAGTETISGDVFFSPDSKWIGFYSNSDRKLKKIPIDGGAPVALADMASSPGYPAWLSDNTIIYVQTDTLDFQTIQAQAKGDSTQLQSILEQASAQRKSEIMRISANGGTPESIFKTKPGTTLSSPTMLPGGKLILYIGPGTGSNKGTNTIIAQSIKSGESRELFAGSTPRYLPAGQIVFMSGNTLYSIGFDPEKLVTKGKPVPMIENVNRYAISDSGMLVHIPYSPSLRTFVWVDRQGREEEISIPPDDYAYPRISPDGTRVAFGFFNSSSDIQIWNFMRNSMTRITSRMGWDLVPLLTPDGKKILFSSDRDGYPGIYESIYSRAADGAGKDEKLFSTPSNAIFPISFSHDGKNVVTMTIDGNPQSSNAWHTKLLSMEGKRTLKPLLQEEAVYATPQISPDGRWIAYVSGRSNQNEICVSPFPNVDSGKWQISSGGGDEPRWSRDGRELFFRNKDAMMVSVIETGPAFTAGIPHTLFRGTYYSGYGQQWDISLDGKHFLMLKSQSAAAAINRILVWVDRNGKEEVIDATPKSYARGRLSPDGTRVALDYENAIWILDLARKTVSRFNSGAGASHYPVWTPDGKKLAFSMQRDNSANVYWQEADGSGVSEQLTRIPNALSVSPVGFTPDGKQVLFGESISNLGRGFPSTQINLLSLEGGAEPKRLIEGNSVSLSADGRWLAYESSDSGRNEIYVRPFSDANGRGRQVSTDGGTMPLWSADGRELFYLRRPITSGMRGTFLSGAFPTVTSSGTMMAVPIEAGTDFKTGAPKVLFQGDYVSSYSVTADGRRFLMIKNAPVKPDSVQPLKITVMNLLEQLKQPTRAK